MTNTIIENARQSWAFFQANKTGLHLFEGALLLMDDWGRSYHAIQFGWFTPLTTSVKSEVSRHYSAMRYKEVFVDYLTNIKRSALT